MTNSGGDAPKAGAPKPQAEWPAKVAGAIEGVAETLRAKAVRPLQKVARAVVFGVIIAVMGLVLVILLSVGIIRVLNVYLFTGQEWASYAIVGGIFLGAGLFLSSLRRPKRTNGSSNDQG